MKQAVNTYCKDSREAKIKAKTPIQISEIQQAWS